VARFDEVKKSLTERAKLFKDAHEPL
jgi:phage regulator Rha-like protein